MFLTQPSLGTGKARARDEGTPNVQLLVEKDLKVILRLDEDNTLDGNALKVGRYHEEQPCCVDGEHSDQDPLVDADRAVVGNQNDSHILCTNDHVGKDLLQVSLHLGLHVEGFQASAHWGILFLCWVVSPFTFDLSRKYAGRDIEVADSVNETLVEDLPVLPEEFVSCMSIVPCCPMDKSHEKHVEAASSHHGPEVARTPGVGKDDEENESRRDLANAGQEKDQATGKVRGEIESAIHLGGLVAAEGPGQSKARGEN